MPYPVLIIDYNNKAIAEMADNIWNAQMACCPTILTYCGPAFGKANRKEAMHFEVDNLRQEIMHILSRDEYPFACTLEGGASSWVGHIPGRQNSAQGGLLAGFLRREGILPCSTFRDQNVERAKFEVRVINHPKGPVVQPPFCKDGKNLQNLERLKKQL
ncbi:MAG TPA: NucA/NucB deoxyribonuclease domain-containing protein [Terracidiphilus sp.]|jgi:hypothetical protein|nr:NucA/NucB deoxyribonuclease domain-containing protein [Terracidiphilus sp.]